MNYRNATDQQLWQYCRQDDMNAYGELFERFMPLLIRFAQKSARDSAIGEELAMDVMFNLWQQRHRDSEILNLEAYVYRCIQNAVIRHFRKTSVVFSSVESVETRLLDSRDAKKISPWPFLFLGPRYSTWETWPEPVF